MKEYTVVGVMSGTSLDGLDIALCNFKIKDDKWSFKILKAKTYPYNEKWTKKLTEAPNLSGLNLIKLHKEYGTYIGVQIRQFLKGVIQKTDLIASHGHTVFHVPDEKLNFQIGDGAFIAAKTGINTVNDFRTLDVALNGQGAPLVPVGDYLLFKHYDFCINLGGFANISYTDKNKKLIAYDNAPANIILNLLAQLKGLPFDKGGEIGRKGKINEKLLQKLNNLAYYAQKPPKSLGKEWIDELVMPIFDKYKISIEDKLRTSYEHISFQIAKSINDNLDFDISTKANSVLFSGGGTHNGFLMELIKKQTKASVIIPADEIIDYKEALIFAFLGVLRMRREINCISSATGADANSSSGAINRIR